MAVNVLKSKVFRIRNPLMWQNKGIIGDTHEHIRYIYTAENFSYIAEWV